MFRNSIQRVSNLIICVHEREREGREERSLVERREQEERQAEKGGR